MSTELSKILAILETIPNAIVTTDENGLIEIFNLAAEPMFQYTAEEVLGKSISMLMPGIDAEAQLRANNTVELEAMRKGGEVFPVELSVGKMHISGRNVSACVIRDISDRIRAEQEASEARDQLIEAEKMASLGNLVAGVAHEINTPIGIGVTAASHLRQQYAQTSREYQEGQLRRPTLEKFLSTCEEATRILETNLARASDLIHSFKQIAVDQSSGELRTFNVREYLDELILSMRPALKKTQLEIKVDVEPGMTISSYPGAISQILTNLIMNSIIHGYEEPATGSIAISFREIDENFELVYRDDGKGIQPDVLENIFEPFFTTRRGGGSSGLGMHIVYNLVKQTLGGEITCDSQPGSGARFTITMPKEPIAQS
ncbi:MAG: PAS domain-containing sensor histidine kinase [bacterium]